MTDDCTTRRRLNASRRARGRPLNLILEALAGGGRKTDIELRDETGLPRRTVYAVLRQLREKGRLVERRCLSDTRKTWHQLKDTLTEPSPAAAVQIARGDLP